MTLESKCNYYEEALKEVEKFKKEIEEFIQGIYIDDSSECKDLVSRLEDLKTKKDYFLMKLRQLQADL